MKMTLEQIKEKYKSCIPVPIVDIANDLGLKVFNTSSLKDSQSGLINKENGEYIVYVNSAHSAVRKRFTIAHEVAHFVLKYFERLGDDHYIDNKQPLFREDKVEDSSVKRKMEIEANEMAAELLMPEKEFKEVWEKANTPEEVAKKFNVSVSAVVVRANRLMGEFII